MQQERINKITEALYSYSASVIKEGILQYASLDELFLLSLHPKERIAFRAAWAVEHVLLTKKILLEQQRNRVLSIFATSGNWSVLRSYSKLVMELFENTTLVNTIENEDEIAAVLNKTFTMLENSNCPIAVRCNTYEILLAFARNNDWIPLELTNRIQLDLEKNNTPALRSRSKKVLKKLERIANS